MDIKLTKHDEGTDDVYSIMQRELLRDNQIDHLIITPKSYISFRSTKLMDELEQSLKYVPAYQVIDMIHKEEKRSLKRSWRLKRIRLKPLKRKQKRKRNVGKN